MIVRRVVVLLTTVLVVSASTVFPEAASASADVCAGSGTLTTSTGIYSSRGVPVNQTASETTVEVHVRDSGYVSFAWTLAVGACSSLQGVTLSAAGEMSGWCDLSTGVGQTGDGHRFAWVQVGVVRVVTGGLVGIFNVIPDVMSGHSCGPPSIVNPGNPGASRFIVTGVFTKTPCLVSTGVAQSTPVTWPGASQRVPVSNHSLVVTVDVDVAWRTWLEVCVLQP